MTRNSQREFVERWRTLVAAFRNEAPDFDHLDVMDFSGALLAVKEGHHIAREGWNGHGLFIFAQAGYPEGINLNRNTAQASGIAEGTVCSFRPYLMMCTGVEAGPGGIPEFTHWVPSIGDVMADDWFIIARPEVTA